MKPKETSVERCMVSLLEGLDVEDANGDDEVNDLGRV